MSLGQFLRKQREIQQEYGAQTAFRFALRETKRKVPQIRSRTKPAGVQRQSALLDSLFAESDEPVWLFWFDGGRLDYFRELADEYLTGELRPVWNGGIGYSGTWAETHLRREMDDYGLFSVSPVRSLQTDYDGRDYFHVAPEIDIGASVDERLAALGYKEQKADSVVNISPGACNQSVREYMDQIDGGIIRYLKPHPPFDGMADLTAGSQKTRNTWYALWSGELSEDEFRDGYVRTYRQAFRAACEVIPELDGKVVITADHGECLGDCGQLYHSQSHEKHEHLCTVPWFEVDDVIR